MTYELRIARQAASYLQRLPRPDQGRFLHRLQQISEDPFGRYTKPLTGPGDRSAARVGGWRIVFKVDEEGQRVDVSDIGPRGEVYSHSE